MQEDETVEMQIYEFAVQGDYNNLEMSVGHPSKGFPLAEICVQY